MTSVSEKGKRHSHITWYAKHDSREPVGVWQKRENNDCRTETRRDGDEVEKGQFLPEE